MQLVQVDALCAQGVVDGRDQFAVIRDPQNAERYWSLQAFCHERGWPLADTKSFTECYEHTLLKIPPFHLDTDRLANCTTDAHGTVCACEQCARPLKLHVTSLAIEDFVFSSTKEEVHVTIASELFWADPRLWGTAVSDITKVWRPHWHIAIHSVNETRGKLKAEVMDRLEETHTSKEQLVAPVYDHETKGFDTKTSYISCLEMDMPQTCNAQDLHSCGVRERLTQTVVVKLAHALYDRYPFDSHIMRILLSFPDPYTFIQPKERLDWGMGPRLEVDWGFNTSGHVTYFENSDGSRSVAPESLITSLGLLMVPEFRHDTSLGVTDKQEFVVTLRLRRRATGILQRFGLPMILLTFITTLVPTLGISQFHPRNIVCIIGMLTAVTLNNGAHASSPAEGTQSTWFDNIFLVSILFSYGALIENFVILWLNHLGLKVARDVIDKFAMYTLPLYYVSIVLLISILQLHDESEVAVRVCALIPLILTLLFSLHMLLFLVRSERKRRAVAAEDAEAAEPLTKQTTEAAARAEQGAQVQTISVKSDGGNAAQPFVSVQDGERRLPSGMSQGNLMSGGTPSADMTAGAAAAF